MTEKGLREVVAAQTKISDIDGEQGRLWYVGYDIARPGRALPPSRRSSTSCTTARCRTGTSSTRSTEFLAEERELSPFLLRADGDARPADLADVDAAHQRERGLAPTTPTAGTSSPEAEYRKAMRLIAKTPTLIATYHRLRTGQEVIPPNPKLPHAANFLWMLLGEEPDVEDADALDTTFVLYARPHDERVHVHGAHHRVHALRHVQRHHGRHRRAEGTAARRRERGVHEDGRGDRRPRDRRGLRRATAWRVTRRSWASATPSTARWTRAPRC